MAKVKEYMSDKIYAVSQKDPIATVRNIFLRKGVSRALVYDEEPKGIITDGDITRLFVEERRGINEVRVREAMTREIITADPEEKPEEAAAKMKEENVSGLPIIKNNEVKGIITNTDLAKYFSERYRGESQVKDLMTTPVETLNEGQSAFHAGRVMEEKGISKIIITRDKKAVGIITETDLSFASERKKPRTIKYETDKGEKHRERVKIFPLIIGDIMKENLITTHPEKDASKEAKKMLEKNIGSLVVIEEEKPIGILTKTDITKYLGKQINKK